MRREAQIVKKFKKKFARIMRTNPPRPFETQALWMERVLTIFETEMAAQLGPAALEVLNAFRGRDGQPPIPTPIGWN